MFHNQTRLWGVVGSLLLLANGSNGQEKTPTKRVRPDSVRVLERRIVALKAQATKNTSKEAPQERTKSEAYEEKESGTDYLEAYLDYLRVRAFPNDYVDWSAYPRAWQHREKMPPAQIPATGGRTPQALSGQWAFVGPKDAPVPYRIYYGVDPINGRVNAIAYHPTVANTYFIGTAGGGIWKTTNGGSSWTPLSDTWPSLQVNAIAIPPQNPDTIYVGTGDFNGFGNLGFGVMKTTDGGATWVNRGKAEFGDHSISDIAVDPENPNIVTVAPGHGPGGQAKLWRSTNGGSSWQIAVDVWGDWSDLAYSAKNAQGKRHLYAAAHYDGGKVYRSDDQGATWKKLAPPIAAGEWYSQNALELATSPTAPDTVYLLVGYDQKIFKSTNAGSTWTDISSGFPTGEGNYNWSQSWYDIHLACSTRTVNGVVQDVIYASLIDLVQSPDGGKTWQALGATYTSDAILHNDQHSLAINPANPHEALIGCDGGIYRLTYNPTANTWTIKGLNKQGGFTQIYRMAAHPTDKNYLLTGAQDNATPGALGDLAHWRNVGGGDGGFCAILDSFTQYATSQNLGLSQTTDGWASSSDIRPDTGSDSVAFIAPIALATGGRYLYAGTDFLYQRDDRTGNWDARLGGQWLSTTANLSYIAVAPSDQKVIYTGSSDGEVWMTRNGGSTWTRLDILGAGLPIRAITSLSVHPFRSAEILVGLSGTGEPHLWRCKNTFAGANLVWENISGVGATALPDIALNAIARDPNNVTGILFVGTDVGVFMSTDSGATWTNATQPLGLPNVQVNDLIAVPYTRSLYAATFGRGLWRIGLTSSYRCVKGKVTLLESIYPVQTLTFTFRPLPSGNPIVRTVTLNPDGSFLVWGLSPKNYNLAIKGTKWLQKVIAVNANNDVTNVDVSLLPGDANNDNATNIFDLATLAAAFNTVPGDAKWDSRCDFNEDDSVDVFDLAILAQYFNQDGDP